MASNKLTQNLQDKEWYKLLVEECKAIITEATFTSRWATVEGYHLLGKRIKEESEKHPFILESVQDLAQSIGLSTRSLYYANQFYNKYPKLDEVPEGKNISWNKLITKYLPQAKDERIDIKLPTGEFNIVYADPPWKYEYPPMGGKNRSIERKYPTMTLEEIKQLKIPSAENSVLFLWATAPKLAETIEVINAWGFNYRTCAVWDKEIIGMGYWFRNQHELLLVSVKGSFPPPKIESRYSSVYREKRGVHSKKPEYYYKVIEEMYPNGKYLELFARNTRTGWESWGNEV